MNKISTRFYEGHFSYKGETEIVLQEKVTSDDTSLNGKALVLSISTFKNVNKRLITNASCSFVEGNCSTHRMFTDFSKAIEYNTFPRITKKLIEEQHNRILENIESIISEAKEFYKI